MADDNLAFLKCFGEAMDKMMHHGYPEGTLVPTGVVCNHFFTKKVPTSIRELPSQKGIYSI